jgi:hypothetical protein
MTSFTKVILTILIALTILFPVGAFAQSQTQGCGGVNCYQPDSVPTPLDNSSVRLFKLQNGSQLIFGVNSEDLTLATGALTTDTAGNLLPAGALILGVTATVTTTITSCTGGWQVGDGTTAGRFSGAADTTLTQGETRNSNITGTSASTGIASLTTGILQAAAAKVRVTCTTSNASAGKVRISVSYLQFTTPVI